MPKLIKKRIKSGFWLKGDKPDKKDKLNLK